MLKVAIVGCGKIADSHASQIQRISGCEIVGVCDKEELMAKQLYDRFPVKRYFSDLSELLGEVHPDVVHITTPPQHHLEIGRQCLEAGCHILVEKPFTLHTSQAEELIVMANQTGRKLTVDHDAQFSDVARRMRKLVRDGYLGGAPVHLESSWCYDLGDAVYAKALLGDKQHWARTLPGGLLHNVISHGVSKIAEFLTSDDPHIIAHGFVSPFLKGLGENAIVDELRVIISEDQGTTAYFTFSSQMRPSLHQFRIYGHKNGLLIDEDQRILIKLRGETFKSYAEHFIPPLSIAKQYLANFVHSARLFLAMDFHMDSGKKHLIESFYSSIIDGTPVPIPYREILLTSKIMDIIFEQIAAKHWDSEKVWSDSDKQNKMIKGLI
jgi:predicted dehydrogenase